MSLRSKFIGDKAFYSKVFTIMIPILVQNVITNFVSLIDNVMVGQLGTEPMSGVAIVNQLVFIFNLCLFGGVSGAGIFTAQYYGKEDHDGVRSTFRAKLIISVILTAIFMVVFGLFGGELITQFLHEGAEKLDLAATLQYGREYLAFVLVQLLPFAISQLYSSTLKETGETALPMKAGIVAVLVNVVFNYILIFGKFGAPALGVRGAAIATVLARIVECAIVIVWTHRHKERNPFIVGAYSSLRIPGKLLFSIVKMGLPLMINETLWSIGKTFVTQSYSLRGLETISALNICSTVANLFNCAFFAFGNAIAIIIGHLLGAGDLERARDEDTKLIFCSVASCVVVGGIMAAVSPFIPNIYKTTELVRHYATGFLLVSSVLMPINAFTHASYFTLRAGGRTIVTFLFDSVFQCVVCVPASIILSRFTGLPPLQLYAIVQSLDVIESIIGFILVKKGVWLKNLVSA